MNSASSSYLELGLGPGRHGTPQLRAISGHALLTQRHIGAMLIWHGEFFLQPKHGSWHADTSSGCAGPSMTLKISLLVLFFCL